MRFSRSSASQADFLVNPNFKTGDHGFMVDFDLDQPPLKAPHEFRLIFTGGSGAAGWGATQPDKFLSSVLERLFTTQAPCRDTRRLRVINLAMGDSKSYQNYIALNRWGHALRLDMIMSYSGFNDINVPWFTLSDGFRNLEVIQAYNRMARYSKSPKWLKFLGRIFPGLFGESALGIIIRSAGIRNESAAALKEYRGRFPLVEKDPSVVMEQLAIPSYVHALKSIKRDFPGIPIVLAFQPYGLTEDSPTFQNYLDDTNLKSVAFNKNHRLDVAIGIERYLNFYELFIRTAEAELSNYLNEDRLFLNPHRHLRDTFVGHMDLGDGVHYNDRVQDLIANHLAPVLFDYICLQNPFTAEY